DAILVSKVVTQHNIHVRDLKDLMARAEKRGMTEKMVFIAGGPRVTHPMALECGFDAGFGVGTKPSEVASYILDELLRRREKSGVKPGITAPRKASAKKSRPKAKVRKAAPPPKKTSARRTATRASR